MTGEFSAETNWAHVRAIGNGTITPTRLTDFEMPLKVFGMPVRDSSWFVPVCSVLTVIDLTKSCATLGNEANEIGH
eukprot:229617-Heterocapsa_arctica.AAC.1